MCKKCDLAEDEYKKICQSAWDEYKKIRNSAWDEYWKIGWEKRRILEDWVGKKMTVSCPMIVRGWSCKSAFNDERSLSRHLVETHSAFDVADLLISTLVELAHAQDELEKMTIPKAEENKSAGAIP